VSGLSHLAYSRPEPSGIICTVTLTKTAPGDASWATSLHGIIARSSEKRGVAIGWNDVAALVMEGLQVSSRLRRDLRAALDAADSAHSCRLIEAAFLVGLPYGDPTSLDLVFQAVGVWCFSSDLANVHLVAAPAGPDSPHVVVPALARTGANPEATLHALEAHFAAIVAGVTP
jgi:hypothetical protein